MNLTLALIINILLDIAIVGLLALVMSRAAGLTPHHQADPQMALSQRSPMPLRHSSTYQTATTIRTPRGIARVRIEPVRK
jgi:hypothetical protein